MKENEIRVGNYVMDKFDIKNERLTEFELEDFVAMDNYRKSNNHPNTYYPIKLTESWLKDLGFENSKTHDKFFTKDNNIGVSTADDQFRFIQGNFVCQLVLRNVEFVHELQNLYYAITGVELSVS